MKSTLIIAGVAAVCATSFDANADLLERVPFHGGASASHVSGIANGAERTVTCYQEGRAVFTMRLSRVQTFNDDTSMLLAGDGGQGRVVVVSDGSSLCVVQ